MEQVNINVTKVEQDVTINATPNVTQIIVTTQNGGGTQNLNDVLSEGNETDGENIFISDGDEITFDNGSRIRKGLTDAGNGGAKGVALVCSLDYELKWEAGRQYVTQQDGFTIREVSHNFTITPSATDDSTKGFAIDSRWILDNGDVYVCTDATEDSAVWELQVTDVQDLQNVTDIGNTTTNDIYIPKLYLYDGPNDNYGSVHYTDGNFHIEDGDGHPLFVVEDGFLQLHLTDTIQSNLFTSDLTETRNHYLPDADGTIALTSDIPAPITIDATPTDGSANAVSSNGVFDALALKQNNLGFTPENVDNKSTTLDSDKLSNIKYPSVKSVFDWAVGLFTQSYIIQRLTTAQRDAIVSPAVGLQIFNTSVGYLEYFDSFWGWMPIDNSNEWKRKNGTEYFNDFGQNNAFNDGVFQTFNLNGGAQNTTTGVPSTNDFIGYQGLGTGILTNGVSTIRSDTNFGRFTLLSNKISFISRVWISSLSTLTDRYNIVFGIQNSNNSSLSTGVTFIYDEGGVGTGTTASPNWQIITANGGVRTNFVTSVPVNINTWYSFRIESNSTFTEIYYYINDVLVRTETTNIPTGSNATWPIVSISKNTGVTNRTIAVDYLGLKIKLNNQR
jgi:hypothetical protein